MLTCPYCQDWEFHPQDRFCGGCGHSYIEVKATIVNALQFEWAKVQGVTIELCNTGRIATGGGVLKVVTEGGTALWSATVPPDDLAVQGDVWQGSWQPSQGRAATVAELRFRPADAGQDLVLGILGFGLKRALVALASEIEVLDIATVSRPEDGSVPVRLRLVQGLAGQINQVLLIDSANNEIEIDAGNAVLRPNRPLDIALPLLGSIRSQLISQPSGIDVTLRVRIQGQEEQRLPLRLAVSAPARVELELAPRWVMQAGRPGFAPITIVNRGGTPVQVTGISLSWAAPAAPDTIKVPLPRKGMELKGGESHRLAFDLPMLSALPATVPASVTVTLGDGQPPVRRQVQIAVRRAQPYDGTVAIDFGTTETAVAVRRGGVNELPTILNLEGEGAFLPTVIAYRLDADGVLRTRVGRSARSQADAKGDSAMIVEGLKWRVADDLEVIRPDGSICCMLEVVADYLAQLKARVEEHVEIGASIETALVTVPSRFSPAQTEALLEAFSLAGIRPRHIRMGSGKALVCESWSPAGLALPLPVLAAMSRQAFTDTLPVTQAREGVFGLVTFDMGGGSTDVSAFRIDIRDMKTITATEIFVDGTNEVAGNVISRLLAQAVMPSLRLALLGKGVQEAAIPIEPPWEPGTLGQPDPVAAENGRALARVVWALQASNSLGTRIDFNNLDDQKLRATAQQIEVQLISNTRLPDLTLRERSGTTHRFSWDEAGLRLDVEGFLRNFIAGPGAAACRLVQTAVDALEATAPRQSNHILMTGRGSLFSLTGVMVEHQVGEVWKQDAVRFRMVDDYLKSITSVGALVLADILPNARGVRFSSGLSAWFGFLGEPDAVTGHPEFVALCQGLPAAQVVAALPPGWADEFRLVLGTSLAREEFLAQTSFRADFEVAVDIPAAPADLPLFVRVAPAGRHALHVDIVAAPDAEAAAAATPILFTRRLGLLPSGYLARIEAEKEEAS